MSADRVAARYSRALIDALAEKDALDQADQFLAFCDLANKNDELSGLFKNASVAADQKGGVVAALAKQLDLPQMICNFLRVLAENGRLDILPEVQSAVAAGLDAHRNVQVVTLTTASKPGDDLSAGFQSAMEKLLGSQVRVETKTDPSILGGAVAQVGSFVYDGSVRAQMNRLRNELIKEN